MSGTTNAVLLPMVRALPRILGAGLGLALLASDRGLLIAAGAAAFVLAVWTNPATWWHYVRTGNHLSDPVPAQFVEPGACAVELQHPGDRPLDIIKSLREITAARFEEAKGKVQVAPVIVATGLSVESAERVCDQLERAGATAVVIEDAT